MRAKNTIVINGKVYDAVSGLPVAAPDPVPREPSNAIPDAAKSIAEPTPAQVRQAVKAKHAHRSVQRSQTLRRDIVKAPVAAHHNVRRKPAIGHHVTSPMVSKFAAHPQPLRHKPVTDVAHAPQPANPHTFAHHIAVTHGTPARHHSAQQPKQPALSSRELKEKLISQRLATIQHDLPSRDHKAPKHSFFARLPRATSVIAASFAIVFLGGYLTYINMPNVSMRVAASRAGVDANFPEYRPDGYRLDGPIAYSGGEVNVTFVSNTNQSGYTVNQKNSSWDSQAVLDNYVSKQSKDYLTYSEQGLTIYTFDGHAAWVNGGVFYTIEGDAPLSSEQILRIASSM